MAVTLLGIASHLPFDFSTAHVVCRSVVPSCRPWVNQGGVRQTEQMGGKERDKEGRLARIQPEGAPAQHGGGEAIHDRLGLDVEVPKKFVGPPSADHADVIAIHAGT